MKPPSLLLGASLIFWGYQTDWLVFAAIMALLIEFPNFSSARWEFSEADLNRIWDLCAVFFFGAVILRYTSDNGPTASAYEFFQWFPLIFFLMALGQAYGNRERIPASVFSWFMRRRRRDPSAAIPAIPTGYFYFAACLISAGAANRRDLTFFAGACALIGWGFWAARPTRVPLRSWISAFSLLVILAYFGQLGFHHMHMFLEGKMSAWISSLIRSGFDPMETRTTLGSIGERKQSGRIVMRVEHEHGSFNQLLRQAVYDTFRQPHWLAARNAFSEVSPESDAASWVLQPETMAASALTVYTSLPRRVGMLALPPRTVRIETLPVGTLQTNLLAAARVTDPPGLLGYRAFFGANSYPELPPDPKHDLHVPDEESPVLRQIVSDLDLDHMPVAKRIQTIQSFLRDHFTYSLYVPENEHRPADQDTPLSRFLLRTKKGHCEYFATATVLLLRAAQIPARYAVGYALQEPNRHGSRYLVRDRHAHAWAVVWAGGRWDDLDTTPSAWMLEEEKQASSLEALADLWSEVRFRFLKWRWLSERGWFQKMAPWLLVPLVSFLSWRLMRRRQRFGPAEADPRSGNGTRQGLDSEFYRIEQRLTELAGERSSSEPMSRWLERIPTSITSREQLQSLLQLHYRYRFDPVGLNDAERDQLREGATRWLESN